MSLLKLPNIVFLSMVFITLSCSVSGTEDVFPHKMPAEKPDIPMSSAMERMFDYPAPLVYDNELFSRFKYTRLEGFDYHGGDGTVSRRDPSRPILVNGKYYIYYTKRHTKVPPIGSRRANEATDEIPSTDWDLCDIWYATSEDGFTWKEQWVAVSKPSKPKSGWRSVCTPDILVWKGKYYLYYQSFDETSGLRGDWCSVSVSYADSPEGPWIHGADSVIPFGKKGQWDQDATHNPQPIVYKGKIYIYYKAAYNKWPDIRDRRAIAHGLAIAENPLGPFKKHPLSPVLNSGHETTYFPFKEGVAALAITDGNEQNTMQYSNDGVNFRVASCLSLTPTAAAPFTPDAFTDTKYGRGVSWGLCHFINAGKPGKRYSIIARFDCDLSLDVDDPVLKKGGVYHHPDVYFKQGLSSVQRRRINEFNRRILEDSKSKSTEKILIPKQANEYVWIYKPSGDYFFGPDTKHLKEGQWYDDWVPNDHTFVKDENGKWHIIGITHPLVKSDPIREGIHEGEFASFHAVSSSTSFKETLKERHYCDLPKILPPKERPGEPLANHAPYIIKKE